MRSVKTENASSSEQLLACRVCLATEAKLYNIHENGLEKEILEVLGIEVSVIDGYPQHVCAFCRVLLVKFKQFRACSQRAQELLRTLKKQHGINTSTIATINSPFPNLTIHTTTLIEYQHQEEPEPTEPVVKDEVESKHEVKYEDLDNNIDVDDNIDYDDEDYKEEVEVKKRKRKRRVEKEVTREKKKLPKEKKIKKMFDCEADFPAFEAKYNMEIVVLTMEQQLENMAARKNSSNYINSPYKCQLCFKGFSSEATFKNHNLKHHDPSVGAQQCELCFSRFRIPAFLRTHAETHRLKFVCKDCRFVASNRYHAITHFREHSGFKYVCKYCGASFKKPSTHGTHVRIQHPTENTSCDVCGETFQGDFGLRMHKTRAHKQPSTHVRIQHPTENTSCDVCGETFQGDFGLRMHKTRAHKQNSENESGSLNCSTCGVQFASSYAMARHTFTAPDNVCNPSMRACTLCGENLATDELLRSHTQERHSKPETKCDECNKTFLTEASLSVHYERVHLQVKSVRRKASHHARKQYGGVVMCELCGKRCKLRIIALQVKSVRRKASHHARKQYGGVVMCELCGKRCKNSTILKYHQRTHTGEKPHSCPRCPKRFVSPMLLHCHLRSHTGERPYKCAQCHKSFTQKSALTVHSTVHTGEKPFACSICGKSFTQAASVHTHVKYVHMKMPAPPRRRNLKRE
ncbi:zinc finger protein 90-like [Cydia splendana]|uniref:zinc finger protein 90-like n=1 Tax=Cydia splendana TaxID=1100963 RepID=UPI00300CEDCC